MILIFVPEIKRWLVNLQLIKYYYHTTGLMINAYWAQVALITLIKLSLTIQFSFIFPDPIRKYLLSQITIYS